MNTVYNFCAGPAMLPQPVMRKAQEEFINWQGLGCSVMEISHRSKPFIALADAAERNLRELLSIPQHYSVLFMHGGGRGQFSAVPLNLAEATEHADYLVTGAWSKSAVQEAERFVTPNIVAESCVINGETTLPDQASWQCSDNAAYFHFCTNETVDGVELNVLPDVGDVPLVADMSSTILSRPLDIEKYGVIYAGAQKNIGPSGLSVVIIRNDLLDRARHNTPSVLNYGLAAQNGSMYNTPPTYAWYLAGLVFEWLKEEGGVSAIYSRNKAKAAMLYEGIDATDFYINSIASPYRSIMNVPFQLADPTLDDAFLTQAEENGLMALKGHRSVGGMRASIYNAMPIEGVKALVDFMKEFERKNG
ncbi:3-phosphoserine/phosphohydroxythreonine transaminase [Aestuariibacter sp. AA17]|uniref:Phosphoserine aminotransferase n=1 Tax=Fluctibacter corallii TaxID=2984329 RepID=A0ABT3A5V6_9ALTE|nr:3-phosphoserine/phosphohydroxythreonine transaminase [Aestuariibacter sp. AA17]MCV2884065.1 3-phosphoserine/phosphohydroxythreonine transaminase [Aestuariibacter sp. AA17]